MNATSPPRICALDGTGPASKVLSHGFESGQRTSGVRALFLEPAKCRCAVASRCADGVRPGAAQRASLILGFIFALLAVALMFVLSWFKPAGQVGQSAILADRDTGAIFVLVDGRLHPALNLISARLIAGQANNPTFVKAAELAKYPQGPTVGIAGAPAAMPLRTGRQLAVGGLRHAPPDKSSTPRPVVTAIGGPAHRRVSARTLLSRRTAVLAEHNDKTVCHLGRAAVRDRPVQQGGRAGARSRLRRPAAGDALDARCSTRCLRPNR